MQKKTEKPVWAARRLSVNVGEKYNNMLDEMVASHKRDDPRVNISDVIQFSIGHYYESGKFNKPV